MNSAISESKKPKSGLRNANSESGSISGTVRQVNRRTDNKQNTNDKIVFA